METLERIVGKNVEVRPWQKTEGSYYLQIVDESLGMYESIVEKTGHSGDYAWTTVTTSGFSDKVRGNDDWGYSATMKAAKAKAFDHVRYLRQQDECEFLARVLVGALNRDNISDQQKYGYEECLFTGMGAPEMGFETINGRMDQLTARFTVKGNQYTYRVMVERYNA